MTNPDLLKTFTETEFSSLIPDPSELDLVEFDNVRVIKQGGMGAIYEARHKIIGSKVAIKVILPHLLNETSQVQRFKLEGQLLGTVDSEHVVKVHNVGVTSNKAPFMIMEFVDGESLRQRLEQEDPVELDLALDIFSQIAKGLGHAHKKNIIHRDVKPDNIMVTKDGDGKTRLKLVDFGIGKVQHRDREELMELTSTGEIVGTPYYMSPEQALGQQLDERCDIYSLGCVMCHVVTGSPPFTGVSVIQVLARHAKDPLPDLLLSKAGKQVPAGLRNIIAKCMEKDAKDRYQSTDELLIEIEKYKQTGQGPVLTSNQKRRLRAMGIYAKHFLLAFILIFAIVAAVEYLTLGM